jgi:hypothetical protein
MQLKWGNENTLAGWNWLCIKILFTWYWFLQMRSMIRSSGSCLYPAGICKLYHFNFLFTGPGKWGLVLLLLVCAALYISEKRMLFATGVLTLLTCLIISRSESTGVLLRATAYTPLFAVQFIAYAFAKFIPGFNLTFYRQQYAVQIIAAIYTVAAISKLSASGLSWPQDGSSLFAIQILKGFSAEYFDTANVSALQKGHLLANALLAHKQELKLLLWGSLLLELFCFTATLHPRLKLIYGIALALMHLGIYLTMNILIGGLVYPMLTFFINPLYLLYLLIQKLRSLKSI